MDFLHNEVGNSDPERGVMKESPPIEQNLSSVFESVYPGVVDNDLAVGSEDSGSLHSVEEVLGDEQHSEVVGDPVQSEQHTEEVVVDPVQSEQHAEEVVFDPVQSEQYSEEVAVDPVQSEQHSEKVAVDPVQSEQHSEEVAVDPVQSEQHSKEVAVDPVQSEQHSEEVVGDQSEQPPLQGQQLHTLQGLHRALQSLKLGQQGNRIAQPIEVSQFHASIGNLAGTEVAAFIFSKVLYNIQLLSDLEYPFSLRAYADAMWLMDMHMKANECVPMVLMQLFYKPADRLNEWLQLEMFSQHLAKFLYLHSRGRGPEMNVFPLYPITRKTLQSFSGCILPTLKMCI